MDNEEEKKQRKEAFLQEQGRFVADATAYGFTEEQAIFLHEKFLEKTSRY